MIHARWPIRELKRISAHNLDVDVACESTDSRLGKRKAVRDVGFSCPSPRSGSESSMPLSESLTQISSGSSRCLGSLILPLIIRWQARWKIPKKKMTDCTLPRCHESNPKPQGYKRNMKRSHTGEVSLFLFTLLSLTMFHTRPFVCETPTNPICAKPISKAHS